MEKTLKGSETKEERLGFWEDQLSQVMRSREMGLKVFGKHTLFNIPGSERIHFLQSISNPPNLLFQKSYKGKSKGKSSGPLSLPNSLHQSMAVFAEVFDPKLYPVIQPVSLSKLNSFSAMEDELLHMGLVSFGPNDIASIQGHFLPTKSRVNIKHRIVNSVRRHRAVSKLLQDYHLLPFKPMTMVERFVLKQGILKYGMKFRNFIDIVFTHIPTGLVECIWNDLCRTGQVPIRWNGERVPMNFIAPAPMIDNVRQATHTTQQPSKSQLVTRSEANYLSSDIDFPTPNLASELDQTPVLVHEDPSSFSSPLRKVASWNSDFETDVEESKPLADISLNKSIERPKVSFAGFYDLDSDDNENIVSPSPCSSPVLRTLSENNTLTLERNFQSSRQKKRSRVNKDLIESTNGSKLRRKFADSYRAPRSLEYQDLQTTFKVFLNSFRNANNALSRKSTPLWIFSK
jgi:hypothetical protein